MFTRKALLLNEVLNLPEKATGLRWLSLTWLA